MIVGIFWKAGQKRPTKDELEQEVKAALPQNCALRGVVWVIFDVFSPGT
jgi:hypothetical protein